MTSSYAPSLTLPQSSPLTPILYNLFLDVKQISLMFHHLVKLLYSLWKALKTELNFIQSPKSYFFTKNTKELLKFLSGKQL